jgi:hypothetical protein
MDDCWVVTYRPSFFHHIGECDNASRVIKYVGILGYRYNSYNLVDMRIHDINVVADLNEHDPNAPTLPPPTQDPNPGGGSTTIPSDGTPGGTVQGGTLSPAIQCWTDSANQLMNQIQSWWEGFWPRLHIMLSLITPMNGVAVLHVSLDLLGDLQGENSELTSPVLDCMSATDKTLWAQHLTDELFMGGALGDDYLLGTQIVVYGLKTLLNFLPTAAALGGGAALACLEAATAIWIVWIGGIMLGLSLHHISHDFVLGLLAMWLDSFMGPFGLALDLFWKSAIYFYIVDKIAVSNPNFAKFKSWIVWSIIGLVAQFLMWAYCYYLFAVMIEISIQNYYQAGT